MSRVEEAHVRSIEIPRKISHRFSWGPGRSFIGLSLRVLALTLALAEALATSELLAKKLILFNAWHTTSTAATVSLTFFTDLALYITPLQAFPYTSSIPSPAGLRQPPAISVMA